MVAQEKVVVPEKRFRRKKYCGKYGNCTNLSEPAHTCPYASDINDDRESLCNCCSECQYECAQAI